MPEKKVNKKYKIRKKFEKKILKTKLKIVELWV